MSMKTSMKVTVKTKEGLVGISPLCNGAFVKIGTDMTWPGAGQRARELAWKLRYSPEAVNIKEMLVVASIIEAYLELTTCTQKKRDMVCGALKSVANAEPAERV